MSVECFICGEHFEPTHGNQRKCSHHTENERKRNWEKRTAGKCVCGVSLSNPRARLCTTCQRLSSEEPARERTERFIALREQGLTNREIAARGMVSEAVVATIFHRAERYGLSVPPPPYWSRKAVRDHRG